MFLAPLPLLGLALGLLLLLTFALAALHLHLLHLPSLPERALALTPDLVAMGLVVAALGIALVLMVRVAGAVPHVPDELSYMFEAKLLATGHFAAPPPASLDSFSWSNPSPIVLHAGKWASEYPFGHPLMLAIGFAVRAPWAIPPLLGAASVALVYLIGRQIYRVETALLAALLFAASPFFLMTASNFMAHMTAAFFLLASVACMVYSRRRPAAMMFAAGLFLGLVVNTRPLTGAALVPCFGLLLLWPLLRGGDRRADLRKAICFAAGGLVMLTLYLGFKFMTTGSPFTTEAVQFGADSFGFSGKHTFAAGLSNEQTQTAYLMLVLHNWPVQLGAALAFLPFVLGTTRRWDWFFAACALAIRPHTRCTSITASCTALASGSRPRRC